MTRAAGTAAAAVSVTAPSIAPSGSCATALDAADTQTSATETKSRSIGSPRRNGSRPWCQCRVGIAALGDERGALAVEIRIVRRPRGQAVHVAVAHAEDGGDEDGVVNLEIRRARGARPRDVLGQDVPPAARGLRGDDQERLQLVGDRGALEVALDLRDEVFVAVQVMRRDRAVNGL